MPRAEKKRSPQLRPEACQILRELLGAGPITLKPLTGGLTNAVFEARVARKVFVLRMNEDPGKLQGFMKEQWAVEQARAVGVPVPEILEVGSGPQGSPYMVVTKAPGAEASSKPLNLHTLRELGGMLRKLHTIDTVGFGTTFNWSQNKLSHNPSLSEYLRSEMKAKERLQALVQLELITPKRHRELSATLRDIESRTVTPKLNHGDPRLKNLLVDKKGSVSAFIDWECSTSNLTPEWDLAIALHDLPIDAKETLVDGYGLTPSAFRDMAPVLQLLNILHYSPLATQAAETKNGSELDKIRTRLLGAFNLY